ncbi:poly-gamma-glutamate synthase PgsB [Isachenkonia alkalipeptolytica]|uniref:Poly-gamma-glutamate synthase PgsB n=1 Tax=Isachenkonia alkalipeptolytica TaxID=2565777 RepID=A0AA43XMJ7_9CLOT|nr:poly-gamma-glutamate synthase PgsB [Isachenkonia alkalipeptolytica]NBG88700.1 poly-gamma-glutamate synthase PgsB [Isachenkonia alkalipeptolytica]
MNELAYISIFAGLILLFGVWERIRLQRRLKKIPKRILVNGIRGKSTVTRLLMGMLREKEYKVAGKTTGTMPRLFYWDDEEEIEIIRSLQGPNISEQKWVVKEVAKKGAEALVTECMAVNPEYQITFQKRLVQANITVITNIIEDHLDVMGPTLDQVAEAFSETIPQGGYLIMPPNPYEEYFRKKAKKRKTKVLIADPDEVTQKDLDRFSYMMFPENVAIGFVLADLWGIDRTTALKGMVYAPVDPGALIVKNFGSAKEPSYFFNGFAANDATSTKNIWERIQEEYPGLQRKIVIMNCREDRVDRTIQFANEVLPDLSMDQLILTGKTVRPIVEAFEEKRIPAKELINLENKKPEAVVDFLQKIPGNTLVYGIGNIHGGGEEIAHGIDELCVRDKPKEIKDYYSKVRDKNVSEDNRAQRSVTAHVRN